MNRKHLIYLAISLVVVSLTFGGIYILSPRPIVKNVDTSCIRVLRYNPYFQQNTDDFVEITNYNEQDVLSCLSRYKEQNSLSKADDCIWSGDIAFQLFVETENEMKFVVIGTRSHSYGSYGETKYWILDDDSLYEELRNILDPL